MHFSFFLFLNVCKLFLGGLARMVREFPSSPSPLQSLFFSCWDVVNCFSCKLIKFSYIYSMYVTYI